MSSITHSTIDLEEILKGLQVAGIDEASIQRPLQAALEEGSADQLLSWARQRGESFALEGKGVQKAIEGSLAIGEALSNMEWDGLDGGKLAPALAGAAAEGYIAAEKGATSDEHLRQRVAELTALHRIISAANSSVKLGDVLAETVQAVVAVTQADICSIFLYEPEWNRLVLAATSSGDLNLEEIGNMQLQVGEGITGWAALVGKPVAVRDAWSDHRFKYVPGLLENRAASILAVPVVLFTKEKLVGVITVHTLKERDFSDNEVRFLETVAGEIAIAIENARLYEQTDARLQQKVAELSTLQGVSAHIAATLDLPEVLTLIAYQAAHLVHADAAAIYELHPDAGLLELVAQYDLRDPNHSIHQGKSSPHAVLNLEESAIGHAISKGIPAPLPPDADAAQGIPFAGEGHGSLFCVPLVAPRAIMGGICLYNREGRAFSEEQVRLLDAFAHEAAIALENSRLYDAALRGLRTKSALLMEMNHRVRNNLQTVAGLLSMQLRRMPSESESATAVRESIARVQSIAVVHDLMVSGDVESIPIYELARKVAEAAISTLSDPTFRLKLLIDEGAEEGTEEGAESVRVGSHEATLLALLFNELVSNAILHGFAGLNEGEIAITASAEEGGAPGKSPRVTVVVRDNGVGLPEGFDPEKGANLGLSIVRTLVTSDLRGTLKMERGEDGRGAVASITFRVGRAT